MEPTIIPSGQVATDTWGNVYMPLSAKGVVVEDGRLWLRQNEFGRWELPGGRVEKDEQPEQTVVREVSEELGITTRNPQLIDASVWQKDFGHNPFICLITFYCPFGSRSGELELEGEAGPAQFRRFSFAEALALDELPLLYKRAIQKAAANENNRD